MNIDLGIKPFLKAINELASAEEQQPCRAQVVEWDDLVAKSFQFFARVAAVFY
tara:strand:- start:519 stop:677 length:159 start_codon:yes stop_codon:yes gene_type:complete